jgi:hypothetical protein
VEQGLEQGGRGGMVIGGGSGRGGCGGGSIENDALLESPYTQAT